MTTLINKFTALFKHQRATYVHAARVNDIYKKIVRGSTQTTLVNDLKLDYIIVVRRGKQAGSIANIDINGDKFRSSVHNVFVKLDQLARHKELAKRIADMPDADDSDDETEQVIETPNPIQLVASAAPETINELVDDSSTNTDRVLMPIIELEEHEMFRDADDNIFPIEVRGERTKDKILFKAKDVSAFAENGRLIEILLRDNASYQSTIDYVILEAEEIHYWCSPTSLKNTNENERVNWDCVYLTLSGLFRVASVSRIPNANLLKLFNWLLNLFYIHQFGSYEERNELARSMFNQVLNDTLSGLYCIDLGTFNDLYDSMNISRETYPPEKYGKYRVCKFGLSKNISTRLTQHKNKKSGYGRWCSDVQFKWLILVSPSQLSNAEGILSSLLKADGYTFNHSTNNHGHRELIMFHPAKEEKVRIIYRQVLDLYPFEENKLSKALEDTQSRFEDKLKVIQANAETQLANAETELVKANTETQLANAETELVKANAETELVKANAETQLANAETQLANAETELVKAKAETAAAKATAENQKLMHENEMLQMQLKLAKMNLA